MEDKVCYRGIDVFKFVMALLIVAAHTHPLYQISGLLNFLTADVAARMTVPFFFASTGFLLEQKIRRQGADRRAVLDRYIRKILGLYCIWTAVYLPIIVWDKIVDSGDTFRRSILTIARDFLFAGSYAHLWYLLAVPVGVALVYGLKKYAGERAAAVILLALFLIGLLTQSYYGLFVHIVPADGILWKSMKAVKKVMVTCRNGVFFGGIFIYAGTWMADRNMELRQWQAVAGLAVSFLLFVVEAAYLGRIGYVREQDMYLMQIPAVFFLMTLAVGLPVKMETAFLRRMSMNIYYVHLIFKFIYRKFAAGGTGKMWDYSCLLLPERS